MSQQKLMSIIDENKETMRDDLYLSLVEALKPWKSCNEEIFAEVTYTYGHRDQWVRTKGRGCREVQTKVGKTVVKMSEADYDRYLDDLERWYCLDVVRSSDILGYVKYHELEHTTCVYLCADDGECEDCDNGGCENFVSFTVPPSVIGLTKYFVL